MKSCLKFCNRSNLATHDLNAHAAVAERVGMPYPIAQRRQEEGTELKLTDANAIHTSNNPDFTTNDQRSFFASTWAPARVLTFSLALLLCSFLPQVSWAQGEEEAKPAGFLEIIFSGGIVGMIMIFILLALSVTAAYLIFDHLISIRRKDLMPDGLSEQVRASLIAGDVKAAKQACNEQPSFLSFVLMHGISELEFGWNAVEKSLEDALTEQSARLFRKIEYLSVIGNIAPMVGLLGTVIGMIIAFQQVSATQGMASAPQLAKGIYQALVTTVGGLIVAIPSIGAFAIFRNRIDQFVAEAAYIAQHVFSPLRRKNKRQ